MIASSPVHADAMSPRRLVSPLQAALGSFFGGPIGFVFFSRANCAAVGDSTGTRKALALSITALLIWYATVAVALFEHESLVLTGVFAAMPFVLMSAAYGIAERQLRSAPGHFVFRSGWNVLGITALAFVASAVCTLAVITAVVVALLATSGFR